MRKDTSKARTQKAITSLKYQRPADRSRAFSVLAIITVSYQINCGYPFTAHGSRVFQTDWQRVTSSVIADVKTLRQKELSCIDYRRFFQQKQSISNSPFRNAPRWSERRFDGKEAQRGIGAAVTVDCKYGKFNEASVCARTKKPARQEDSRSSSVCFLLQSRCHGGVLYCPSSRGPSCCSAYLKRRAHHIYNSEVEAQLESLGKTELSRRRTTAINPADREWLTRVDHISAVCDCCPLTTSNGASADVTQQKSPLGGQATVSANDPFNPSTFPLPKWFTVLGIETSCDDTAAAVVRSDGVILSMETASQGHLCELYGGVKPSAAAAHHREVIDQVIEQAVTRSGLGSLANVDAIATTIGPGLELCLRVGFETACRFCRTYQKPFMAIHHVEAHFLSARLYPFIRQMPLTGDTSNNFSKIFSSGPSKMTPPKQKTASNSCAHMVSKIPYGDLPTSSVASGNITGSQFSSSEPRHILAPGRCTLRFPYLGVIVSGGHTLVALVRDVANCIVLAHSEDDAVGEAFDKVARALGLSIDTGGGPAIEAKAAECMLALELYHPLPQPFQNYPNTAQFSFAGMKTAAIRAIDERRSELELSERDTLPEKDVCNFAAAFQHAAFRHILTQLHKCLQYCEVHWGVTDIAVVGGVASNEELFRRLQLLCAGRGDRAVHLEEFRRQKLRLHRIVSRIIQQRKKCVVLGFKENEKRVQGERTGLCRRLLNNYSTSELRDIRARLQEWDWTSYEQIRATRLQSSARALPADTHDADRIAATIDPDEEDDGSRNSNDGKKKADALDTKTQSHQVGRASVISRPTPWRLFVPPPWICRDNGAMIGWAAVEKLYKRRGTPDILVEHHSYDVLPRWRLGENAHQNGYHTGLTNLVEKTDLQVLKDLLRSRTFTRV